MLLDFVFCWLNSLVALTWSAINLAWVDVKFKYIIVVFHTYEVFAKYKLK
jgi:hypothetical protein